ncbi:hypothetical protein LJC23_07040, partial [Desulfovibrio sp. OttesenSCG-928-I05]|nr:hypothetical protein [Desulfovibrio sp. OttesenSCG-928-I05]
MSRRSSSPVLTFSRQLVFILLALLLSPEAAFSVPLAEYAKAISREFPPSASPASSGDSVEALGWNGQWGMTPPGAAVQLPLPEEL